MLEVPVADDSGFVLFYRKMLSRNSPFIGDLPLLGTLFHLIMRASYCDQTIKNKNGHVDLKRGQCVIGLREFSKQIGITPMQLRRTLRQHADNTTITHQTTHLGTIITIVNFDSYQSPKKQTTHQTSSRHTLDILSTTPNKELKKERTKEELTLTSSGNDEKVGSLNNNHFTAQDLADIWNARCGSFPKVSAMNKKRTAIAKQRIAENADRTYWENVVDRVVSWEWARTNDRGWKPNFDFLVRPNTHLRATEGEFDAAGTVGGKTAMQIFMEQP
jgi:hypothetical protein